MACRWIVALRNLPISELDCQKGRLGSCTHSAAVAPAVLRCFCPEICCMIRSWPLPSSLNRLERIADCKRKILDRVYEFKFRWEE